MNLVPKSQRENDFPVGEEAPPTGRGADRAIADQIPFHSVGERAGADSEPFFSQDDLESSTADHAGKNDRPDRRSQGPRQFDERTVTGNHDGDATGHEHQTAEPGRKASPGSQLQALVEFRDLGPAGSTGQTEMHRHSTIMTDPSGAVEIPISPAMTSAIRWRKLDR